MPKAFHHILDCFKFQEMCEKPDEAGLSNLGNVPDHFKTQDVCDDTVRGNPSSLIYVPDWFVRQ